MRSEVFFIAIAFALEQVYSELTFEEKLDLARKHAPFVTNGTVELDTPPVIEGRAYIKPGFKGLERWPNARMPYELAPTIVGNDELAFLQGVAHIMDNSPCIVIEPKTDADTDYVYVDSKRDAANSGRCRAAAAYRPGAKRHYTHLGERCFALSIVTHELLHNLGAMHEQKRPDAGLHVTILWDNITDDCLPQFYRNAWDTEDPLPPRCRLETTNYDNCYDGNVIVKTGLPYDTRSVMHYRQHVCRKHGTLKNMLHVDPELTTNTGNSKLSIADVYKFNHAYGCPLTECAIGGLIWGRTSGGVNGLGTETECRWDIMVKPGKKIKATFRLFKFSDCTDKVTIKQGTLGTAVEYCSTNPPPLEIITDEYELTVIMNRTNLNNQFYMYWEVYGEVTPAPAGALELTPENPCFTALTPGYPSNYTSNLNLEWKFFSSSCTAFSVDFATPFGIAETKRCKGDYVQVWTGKKSTGSFKTGKRLCGTKAKTVDVKNKFSTENAIRFVSDSVDEGVGFEARVCAICG